MPYAHHSHPEADERRSLPHRPHTHAGDGLHRQVRVVVGPKALAVPVLERWYQVLKRRDAARPIHVYAHQPFDHAHLAPLASGWRPEILVSCDRIDPVRFANGPGFILMFPPAPGLTLPQRLALTTDVIRGFSYAENRLPKGVRHDH